MTESRDQVIQALRRYCKKNGIPFEVDRKKGKGSHYWVRVGDRATTVQQKLNPGRIERFLKQLGVDPTAI